MKNWLLLGALLLAAFAAANMPAWAQSNCTTNSTATGDEVHCGPGTVDSTVSTFDSNGNDTITTTDADFGGNRVFADTGNDSVDAGTSTIDLINAGPGTDTVTVEGSTLRKVTGSDGTDNITISAGSNIQIVGGDIDADTGADDTISVINSTVGTVGGDDPDNSFITGGNDVITITGSTVDNVTAGKGNDQVTIQDGTTITNDISGDDGADTLSFSFTTNSKSEYNNFQQQLNAANPQNGAVTWRGVTYSFNTFEALQNLIELIKAASGGSSGSDGGGGSSPVITDGRLDTNPAATAITYCTGGEIQVYAADGSGLIVAAHAIDLAGGKTAAAANVQISYDTNSGSVIVSVGGTYTFTFPAVVCPG